MIIQIISSYIAILMFALVLETPRKYLLYAGFTGAVAWTAYLIIKDIGGSSMAAAFISTLCLALLCHILARVVKAPVTVFLIPGILPVVPGGSIYRTVYYIIGNDFSMSVHYLIETLQIAGAMALAVFIMDSVFQAFVNKCK